MPHVVQLLVQPVLHLVLVVTALALLSPSKREFLADGVARRLRQL